jgi:diguanylate cyclase (GGDEF)-like protein
VTHSPTSGEVDGVVAISRDMTAHKDSEEKLAALATSDGLTGLANRRHFDARLEDEWEGACRSSAPLSLVLIDVDHFKKFNDLYGHPGGDVCLRSIARVISGFALGPNYFAARYGGEEFALLLPGLAEREARSVVERLVEAVRDINIPHARNFPTKRVTISAGLSTAYPVSDGSERSSIVADADRALYAAKAKGRDGFAVEPPNGYEVRLVAR